MLARLCLAFSEPVYNEYYILYLVIDHTGSNEL